MPRFGQSFAHGINAMRLNNGDDEFHWLVPPNAAL
jgi:hypothetical protein